MPQPKAEDLRCKQTPKRRKVHTYSGPEPSVEDIEAEFWRIVETPDDVYESLYGQVSALHRCSQHLVHGYCVRWLRRASCPAARHLAVLAQRCRQRATEASIQ